MILLEYIINNGDLITIKDRKKKPFYKQATKYFKRLNNKYYKRNFLIYKQKLTPSIVRKKYPIIKNSPYSKLKYKYLKYALKYQHKQRIIYNRLKYLNLNNSASKSLIYLLYF